MAVRGNNPTRVDEKGRLKVPTDFKRRLDEEFGETEYFITSRDGERAELGIMLRPDAWNRGVAKEVFGPLLEYAFAAMQLAVIDAERRDDAHAGLIDRLLHPFGFSDSPPTAAGLRRWALHSERWRASADSRQLA